MRAVAHFLLVLGALLANQGHAAPAFSSQIQPLPTDLQARIRQHSWRPGCPVALRDLRLVTVTHWDFAGQTQQGQLVVHHKLAHEVVAIFTEIFEARFVVEKMRLIEHYEGSDDASMADNNTSAFNCRSVTGKPGVFSRHSHGTAIDINPLRNPYVKGRMVDPPAGRAWLNRANPRPGMIVAGGPCQQAFVRRGWRWGGAWRSLKDYQHFDKKLR